MSDKNKSAVDALDAMLVAERELMLAKQAASKSRGDRRHGYEQSEHAMREARAAVAELMDAARLVLRYHDVCVKNGHFNLTFDQERALRAALARCKGA